MTIHIVVRYVRHSLIPAYEDLGWEIVDDCWCYHHDHYSRLMQWIGEGEPVEPEVSHERA